MIEIRVLTDADAGAFRAVRLRALQDEPAAFTNSYEEFSQWPLDKVAARLRGNSADNFMLGAFNADRLMGLIGFYRESALKLRHKGSVISLYVAPEAREQGLATALLRETIDRARSIAGLEQLLLGVVATQTVARKLYESLGFVVFGREPRAVKIGGAYYDEEFMTLDLREDGP